MADPNRRPAGLGTLGLLVIMGAAWGLEFSMLKLAVEAGYPETGVLLVTLALVALVFWTIVAVQGLWFALTRRTIVFLIMLALLGYVFPLLAALWASPYVPAGLMTLIASFTPVVTVATALLCRTERVSARRILAVVFGLAAALLVLLPEAQLPQAGNLLWLLLVFVVPLTYGVESVYVSWAWPDNLSPMQIGAGQSLLALFTVMPIHFAVGEPLVFDPTWPMGQIAILIVAGCVLTEVFLYFAIIRATGGVLVSFAMYLSLFAGIAWGAVIFGERLDLVIWIALGLLLVGLSLTIPSRRERKATAPAKSRGDASG
jgi:O-acetylserine/cysteine efflux transporter